MQTYWHFRDLYISLSLLSYVMYLVILWSVDNHASEHTYLVAFQQCTLCIQIVCLVNTIHMALHSLTVAIYVLCILLEGTQCTSTTKELWVHLIYCASLRTCWHSIITVYIYIYATGTQCTSTTKELCVHHYILCIA